MSCFCVRGFGGRLGFLSFWGLFWLVRRVFSGSGFFWFLGLLAFLRFGRGGWGVGLSGVFSGSGLVRPVLAPCGGGGRVRPARPAPVLCAGVGCVCAPGSCVFVRGLGACAPGS